MNQQRYSESQVLCGLREVWQDVTGNDEPFFSTTCIYTFMKADGTWDDLDLADVFCRSEEIFGFECTERQWKEFFGFDVAEKSFEEWEREVAPKVTFGALARFIAERAPVVATFGPVCVLGRECAPAGVFTGIQRVAGKVLRRSLRFPPSARIIDILQGSELDKFWTQLRWMTEYATPGLPASWRNAKSTAGCCGVLAVIVASIISWETSSPVWLLATLILAVAAYLCAAAYKRFTNPLPSQLETFRDLCEVVCLNRK